MASAVEGSPFSPEQLQYWETHPGDSLVPNIIACVAVTGVLSTLFVALRLLGRWRINNALRFHSSDWLVVVAWVRCFLHSLPCNQ